MISGENANRKLQVLLLQLPVPNNPALNTALAAGYLKAYAYSQGLDQSVDIEILPRYLSDYAGDALLVNEIVRREPDVLGASLYTWNSERSLAVIEQVKEWLPHLRVVVGGPEVQKDNLWVLEHPSVTVAVIGEGEQTFAELLRLWCNSRRHELHTLFVGEGVGENTLASTSGIAYCENLAPQFTAERVPLNDLAVIPSPYLAGYLEVPSDGMLMVEVSRWCPYSCSFCLYGRSLGPKLGNRYFGLDRILAEIIWARKQGVHRVHFVEANLNLVPLFWPLMRALEELNADHQMTFYAELRGEYLSEEVVAALDRANVRYVEVGLQTANQTALKASLRRTDLQKWADGTRRLHEHQIEVFLDVILGLPADDEAGIAETLDFIRRENLGPYDVFTLQVLPGTSVRQQAEQFGLRFQDRPPYYVMETNTLLFHDLQRLRRDLKAGVNILPDVIEGLPKPRHTALIRQTSSATSRELSRVSQLWLLLPEPMPFTRHVVRRLASQVDVIMDAKERTRYTTDLADAINDNPSTIFDVYLLYEGAPESPDEIRNWRSALPFQPGYFDRLAVFHTNSPEGEGLRINPRCFLLLPWVVTVEPADYRNIAEIVWRFDLTEGEEPPLNAWYVAGGAGICLRFAPNCSARYRARVAGMISQWERETGQRVWRADDPSAF